MCAHNDFSVPGGWDVSNVGVVEAHEPGFDFHPDWGLVTTGG